jgi:DNA-binding transcriptional MerR regulator
MYLQLEILMTGTDTSNSYRIRSIAERVGVPRPTLVAWGRRFDILDPPKSTGGVRFYSEQDLRVFLRLKELLDTGLRISEAAEQVKSEKLHA